MKAFFKLISISIQRHLYYRTSFIINLIAPIFVLIGQYLLWIALYKQQNNNDIGGLSQREFFSYILLAFALNNLFGWSSEKKLAVEIKRGTVVALFIRPVSFLNQYISEMIGASIPQIIVNTIIVLCGFLFFENHLLIPHVEALVPFFPCFILSLLLRIMLIELFSLMCFFTTSHSGISWIRIAIFDFFSGAIIPLMLFPGWLRKIAYLTPFPYMIQVPIGILLGNELPGRVGDILVIQLLWLAAFFSIHALIFKYVRKNMTVAGG